MLDLAVPFQPDLEDTMEYEDDMYAKLLNQPAGGEKRSGPAKSKQSKVNVPAAKPNVQIVNFTSNIALDVVIEVEETQEAIQHFRLKN